MNEPTRIIKALEQIAIPGSLAGEGLTDDEKLWAKLAASDEAEIARLLSALGIGKENFLETITPLALLDAGQYGPNWLQRYWFDLLRYTASSVALAICVFMAGRLLMRPVHMEVIAATDLRPFELIKASSIRLRRGASSVGSLHDVKDALGKYPLHEIAHGKSLLVADLSPRALPNSLTGRSVLRVSIKHAGAFDPWRLPLEVTLLLAPQRDRAGGPIQLPHSYVLATKDTGDVTLAWVAVENGRIGEIAAAVAHSDVFTAVEGR